MCKRGLRSFSSNLGHIVISLALWFWPPSPAGFALLFTGKKTRTQVFSPSKTVSRNTITNLQISSTPVPFVFHCAYLEKLQPWINLALPTLCQPTREHLRFSGENYRIMRSGLAFMLMTIHLKWEIRDTQQFYYILFDNPLSYMVTISHLFLPFHCPLMTFFSISLRQWKQLENNRIPQSSTIRCTKLPISLPVHPAFLPVLWMNHRCSYPMPTTPFIF